MARHTAVLNLAAAITARALAAKRTASVLLSLVVLTPAATPAFADTAIVNVNVIPMTEEVVQSAQTVLVAGGRIEAIGPVDELPVPETYTLVDGTDRYLIPGLGEMHAHVPPAGSGSLDRILALFAVNGVTTIRGMLGHPSHLELRGELDSGQRFGPRLVTSGPSLNGNSVTGAADGRRQVEAQHAAGYDFIKIHPGLEAREFAAIAETANALGMPFVGHVPVSVGVRGALSAGIASIEHLDGYMAAMLPKHADGAGGYGGFFGVLLADNVDIGQLEALVADTEAAGTWNVPTQTLIEQLIDATPVADLTTRTEMACMPPATVRAWADAKTQMQAERDLHAELAARAIAIRRQLIRELHARGNRLLLGSDAPQVFNVPGFSAHRELELYVAAGLTPYEALATGTRDVARFLGLETGRIEVGQLADLVLLDENPLEDIRNLTRVHGVMLGGRWHSKRVLLQKLDELCSGQE